MTKERDDFQKTVKAISDLLKEAEEEAVKQKRNYESRTREMSLKLKELDALRRTKELEIAALRCQIEEQQHQNDILRSAVDTLKQRVTNLRGQLYKKLNKHLPITTMLSSPEGNEPRYQNLDHTFPAGVNLGPIPPPRARSYSAPKSFSRTVRETKFDSTEQAHYFPSDYEIVKLSNSRPNMIPARHSVIKPRKYSEGSKHQMFTQSEGSGSPVLEMMRERAPDSQTRPKNYERSYSGGYNKHTPPHHRSDIEAKSATPSSVRPSVRCRPFRGQLYSYGGMKRARSFSGSFDHGESLASIDQPLDPNLVCPECGVQFRQGQIQKYRSHYKLCKK